MNTVEADLVQPGYQRKRLTTNWMIWYSQLMAKRDPFPIDLSDPQEIGKALARAEEEVVGRRDELKEAVEQLNYWEMLYERLATLAGQHVRDRTATGAGSVRKRIERIVAESETPVDADRLMTLLPGAQRKTVSWNLWDLERKGKIKKVASGVYARLDFKPDATTTLLDDV